MKAEDIEVGGYYQGESGWVALVRAMTNIKIKYDLFDSKGLKLHTNGCSPNAFIQWAQRRVKPNDDQKNSTEV
jgi:hypothetical protein